MSSALTEEQVDDLLDNVLDTQNPNYWKQGEKLVCCPVHGESNPSMGISIDKQVCHCFSCSFAGDFAKLLIYSKPEMFGFNPSTPETKKKTEFRAYRKAREFLAGRYELEFHEVGQRAKSIKRYEQTYNKFLKEDRDKRIEIPRFKIAPYMSGKETYAYFFQRGFTKDDMQKFMIGRDLDNKTITIPVFHEDGALAGVIGRYIDKNRKKNQRYKIYDEFERSSVLYPVDKAKPIHDTFLLVEGQFDAIKMHSLGFTNTLAVMTNQLSKKQAEWLCANCSEVIWIGDNDSRGIEGRDNAYKLLKNKIDFKIVDYPDYGKDVCDWDEEDIRSMIDSAHGLLVRKIKRYD